MDITIAQKSILQFAAERVLENLCNGKVFFLSKPEPLAKTYLSQLEPSSTGYPLDNHRNLEIVQVIRGRGRLKCAEGIIELLPQEIVFITPDTLHGETYHKSDMPYVLLWIVVYPTGVGFFLSEYNGKSFLIRSERYLCDMPVSHPIWDITTTCDLTHDLLGRARMQEYLLHACCEVAERSANHEGMLNYHQKLVEQIRCYLDLHYTEQVSVKELSQIARCSANHLNTLFRQYVGIPIHQYILRQRFREAKYLLENSSYTIKEIAYRLGFKDPLYFSRIFRKCFSISPSETRAFSERKVRILPNETDNLG